MSTFALTLPPMLLRVDRIVVRRRGAYQGDAMGNNTATTTVVTTITRGTYADATDKDIAKAGERSATVDAVVAFMPGTDIRVGDYINVRSLDFEVVAVEDARNRTRAHIRRYLMDTPEDDRP